MGIRVTTQMLGYSRRRAGLDSGSTLAKYMNQGGTGSQSYYNVLNKNSLANKDRLSASRFSALQKNSAADRYEKSRYEKMEKAAGKLTQQTAALGEKVDGSGEEIDIATQAAGFVDAFNENLSNLKQSTDILDKYYHQSMKETALGNKNALEEIGITVASNGLLTLDKEKLAGADGEKVKKLLGTQGDFLRRIGYVSSRIADNAAANVESASSQYNSRGDIMNSYLSRFNRRG